MESGRRLLSHGHQERRFMAARKAQLLLQQQAQTWPMPRAVKRLRSRSSPLASAPRSRRRVPRSPARTAHMAALRLRKCVQRATGNGAGSLDGRSTMGRDGVGDVPLKTSPSGGARHPIECYVCVRRLTGVRAGLYHYAADIHALEKIRGGDLKDRLRVGFPHSEYFAKAAFVVILTAVFERQLWRYPYARVVSGGAGGGGPCLPDLLPDRHLAGARAVLPDGSGR